MVGSFITHHKKELALFGIGVLLAVLFVTVPSLHRALSRVDQLGYPGMLLAGLMYGSGLTASLATVIFIDSPPGRNLVIIGLLGGLGSAFYDLTVFLITRRGTSHGWIAKVVNRVRERHYVPNWITLAIGMVILISPLPDELAAGLFGINHGRAFPFFCYSFASNTIGVLVLSGVF